MIKKITQFFWLSLILCLHKDALSQGNWIAKLNALPHQKHSFKNEASNLLFDRYPKLKEKIPYIQLADLPTPVEKLDRISQEYGIALFIKRDDLTGGLDTQGVPLYGGNKVRKLEFLLAQAQAQGAKNILTFGAAGSNHVLATAAHAQRLGMHTLCMLKPQANSTIVQHNLLLHLNYNSELFYNLDDLSRDLAAHSLCLEYLKKEGQCPYIIPTGGSNILGTLGFVNAALELNEQIKQGHCPKPTHIYVACGSCSTTAGLLLGFRIIGLDIHIIAVTAEPDQNNHFAKTIAQLFYETNQFLHDLDESFPLCSYTDNHLTIDFNFCGLDYGVSTPEANDALRTLLELEHIPLECTYTAKAFAALLATAPKIENGIMLFWNTYYNCPLAIQSASLDYHQLPACFHVYF